jgi:UrcA family protein
MNRTHAALIAFAIFATGTPSFADVVVKESRSTDLPYREVRFNDLNLDSREGIDRLNFRIIRAVRQVCGTVDNRLLSLMSDIRNCRDQSLQRAFADRDVILAARLAARGQPDKLAAISGSIGIAAAGPR